MKKILYLPTETTARELDARLLLAHGALSRGYCVIIGRRKYAKLKAEEIGYGVYLDKGHNVNRVFPFNGRNDSFCKASVDEEGLVFLSDDWFIVRSKPEILSQVDVIFSWGKYQKDVLTKANPRLKDKIVPVGNPRFDLLRPEYSSIYSSPFFKKKNKLKNYILINTNFTPGNLNSHYKHDYIGLLNEFGRIKSEYDLKFWTDRQEYYGRLIDDYREMVINLSKKFRNIDFVLRPHPSENISSWKNALKGYDNVRVIFKGGIVDWIHNATAVIHTGCTTGIEAWALNKPVFRYNPEPESIYESGLPSKFGYNCSSINKLERLVALSLKNEIGGSFREQIPIIKPFMESINCSKLSIDLMLDAFDEFYSSRKTDNFEKEILFEKIKRTDSLINRMRFAFLRLLKCIRVTDMPFFSRLFSSLISQNFQKFSGIGKKLIKTRFRQFDNVHGKKINGYKIKKIASDTYIIKRL